MDTLIFQHTISAYLSKGVNKSQLGSANFAGRQEAVAFGFVLANISVASICISSTVCDRFHQSQ